MLCWISKKLHIQAIDVCLNENGLHKNWPQQTPLHKLRHVASCLNFARSCLKKVIFNQSFSFKNLYNNGNYILIVIAVDKPSNKLCNILMLRKNPN